MWIPLTATTISLVLLALLTGCPQSTKSGAEQTPEQAQNERQNPNTQQGEQAASFRLSLSSQKHSATESEPAHIQVQGDCTLPDQAMILVSLLDPEKEASFNRNVISQEFAFVKDQKYAARIPIPADLPAGRYLVRARFSPESYDPNAERAVTQAVGGRQGSKLSGPQMLEEEGVKMLVNTMEIDL